MNRLFIAEKPSVAKAIAGVLGVTKSTQSYKETKTGDVITWCFGHMFELAEPDFYLSDDVPLRKNGKDKVWRLQDLPIIPQKWEILPKKDCKAQLKVIASLLKRCDQVVNCGDPDREGQLLVDEILEKFGNKKPVLRYWASAQDDASVKKALAALEPNKKYQGMTLAAKGRQRADWLIGMNLTRAYTIAAQRCKVNELFAIGRVQTPTLNLVATRDQEIENFKPVPYYKLAASFSAQGITFEAQLKLPDDTKGLDSSGRLIDLELAKRIGAAVQGAGKGEVSSVVTKEIEQDQPKSLSLADIQLYASSKWGFSASKTLEICQSLYETHKLATYPRSDSSYLPEVQFDEAKDVLSALSKVNPDLAGLIAQADPSIKSKTWNNAKVTAHHGIIPTKQVTDRAKLSDDEQKVYRLIVERYLAQFFPKCKISQTKLSIKVGSFLFTASGSVVLRQGFKAVIKDDEPDAQAAGKDVGEAKPAGQKLPACKQGDVIPLLKVILTSDKTKAPSRFTEGTLIRAMENIASVVDDPTYKRLLKEGDGIGTSATRAAIIEELKRKKYLALKGKFLIATPLGRKLLQNLPDMVKNPVLTAVFESKLKDIASGKLLLKDFEQDYVVRLVKTQVDKSKTAMIK